MWTNATHSKICWDRCFWRGCRCLTARGSCYLIQLFVIWQSPCSDRQIWTAGRPVTCTKSNAFLPVCARLFSGYYSSYSLYLPPLRGLQYWAVEKKLCCHFTESSTKLQLWFLIFDECTTFSITVVCPWSRSSSTVIYWEICVSTQSLSLNNFCHVITVIILHPRSTRVFPCLTWQSHRKHQAG